MKEKWKLKRVGKEQWATGGISGLVCSSECLSFSALRKKKPEPPSLLTLSTYSEATAAGKEQLGVSFELSTS